MKNSDKMAKDYTDMSNKTYEGSGKAEMKTQIS